MNTIKQFTMSYGYISGLTQTDGSFFCSIILSPKHRFGLQFRPKFTITADLDSKHVLDSIKYKTVFGVRLEAAGRLSKRLIASRSVFKLKYKGNLKNIDSSYKGISSVILKGNTKSNIQYTKISSKTRNGSFGLKGWVSGN